MADGRWQNKYRIESARAIWHDYDGGIYFITICTKNREHFFGEIGNGEMVLSDIGKYAVEQFNNVTSHYPYAEIPLFTIMPNHVHAIVVISACRDVACYVSMPTETIAKEDVALRLYKPNGQKRIHGRKVTKTRFFGCRHSWIKICGYKICK